VLRFHTVLQDPEFHLPRKLRVGCLSLCSGPSWARKSCLGATRLQHVCSTMLPVKKEELLADIFEATVLYNVIVQCG